MFWTIVPAAPAIRADSSRISRPLPTSREKWSVDTARLAPEVSRLSVRLCREPLLDSFLDESKELLNVGKSRLGIVVVIHQPVFELVALGQDLVDHKTRLLHRRASVLEVLGDVFGCLLQRAVEAIGPVGCRTLPIVCAIPLGW